MSASKTHNIPHPVVWTILYLPFGALFGFGSVALTNVASQRGVPVDEATAIIASGLLVNWLKWLWAPVVDITLSPRLWYVIATVLSGVGVFAMSAVPLDREHLPILIAVIASANIVNSIVGMAVEAIIAGSVPTSEAGRVGAWFQAGNLGGAGLGGGLGLFLLTHLPSPWMSGAIMAVLFFSCCLALAFTPRVTSHHKGKSLWMAILGVLRDLWTMLQTKGGLEAAILCALPVGTGAAQGLLAQDQIAQYWSAGSNQVALTQGVLSGVVTAVGCFIGGFLCRRFHPRVAYAGIGIVLAVIAVGMGIAPHGPIAYVVWSMIYALGVGLAYAAFTAVVLDAMGPGSGATKYNMFASLSNFPIWWLSILLGKVAKYGADRGAPSMLFAEAAIGVGGVLVFAVAVKAVQKTKLPA